MGWEFKTQNLIVINEFVTFPYNFTVHKVSIGLQAGFLVLEIFLTTKRDVINYDF